MRKGLTWCCFLLNFPCGPRESAPADIREPRFQLAFHPGELALGLLTLRLALFLDAERLLDRRDEVGVYLLEGLYLDDALSDSLATSMVPCLSISEFLLAGRWSCW